MCLVILLLVCAAVAHATRAPVTFLDATNAYLQYYKWTAPSYGRVELHFKTSHPNATLFYIGGQGHHVHLSLVQGRMMCSAQLSTYQMSHTALQHWNDDQWHKIVLTHKLGMIQVTVDDSTQAILQDQQMSSFETGFSPLYIGGVPKTVSSNFTSFHGCILGVKVANFTLLRFRAKFVSPVGQNNTQPGCNGPCELNPSVCNDEDTCVGNWSNNKTICKCEKPQCTTKNITGGVLNGSHYQCYPTSYILEPYIPGYLMVGLEFPVPSKGVIFSFHGYLGQTYTTVLYLQNYKLFYSIQGGDRSVQPTNFNTNIVLSPFKNYLISVIKKRPFITVTVTVAPTNDNLMSKTINMGEFFESRNELLCIGGGSVGMESYKGTVSGVNHEGLIISSVINIPTITSVYIGTPMKKYMPLPYTLFTNGHIEFNVWTEHPGSLIYVESIDYYSLDIQLYPGEVALTWSDQTYSCYSRNIITKQWLSFQMDITINHHNKVNGLEVTVDNFHCVINNSNFTNTLKQLDRNILFLGSPLTDNNNTVMFRGRIENVTTNKGSPLQLNLESMIDKFLETSLDGFLPNNATTTGPQATPTPIPTATIIETRGCYIKPTNNNTATPSIGDIISTPSIISSIAKPFSSNKFTPSPSSSNAPFPNERFVPKVYITSTKYHTGPGNVQEKMVLASFAVAAFVIIISIAGVLVAMSWYVVKMMHMKRVRAKLCKTTVALSNLVTSEVIPGQDLA